MNNLSKWLGAMSLLVAVSASAVTESKNGATLTTYDLPAGWIQNLSDNGQWAIWNYPSNDEPDASLSIIDVRQGKLVQMPVDPEYLEGGHKAVPSDITDDGKYVFGSYDGMPGYYDADLRGWLYLPMPRALRKWNGTVEACTPDGKVLVGLAHQAWSIFTGLIWIYNEDTEEYDVVTNYKFPTREDVYNSGQMLQGDWEEYLDAGDTDGNIRLFQISSDGKYVIGGIDHNRNWGNSCFLYDVEKGEYSWITYEEGGKTYYAKSAEMSNDGNWLYANMMGFDMEDDEQYVVGRNFLKNMKTGEITFPKNLGGVDKVDNFGRFYYAVGATTSNPISSLCVDSDGHLVDLHMILSQVYDIDFGKTTSWTSTGFTMGVSSDGLVLACNAYPRDAAYVVTLPVPLHEAAGNVNVLSNYQYAPEWGSELAHFKNFTLALSNSASVSETIKAKILDESGNTVAEHELIKAANDANQIFNISFPEKVFTPGMTYTVLIPEGLFYVDGTSSKNPEIRVNYVGREDGPVKPGKIDPDNGSNVRELNLSNPVIVNFNADISRVNGVYGGLYQKGSTSPIALIDGSASGRRLALYCPSDYKLKKGVEYVVRIPEGFVTDIVGFCANEEFEIEYTGAYLGNGGDNAGVRFYDDFNNPNESLNLWLNYEGDHNTPTDFVAAFGFDTDNTPWNFSVHDDEAFDYCAASHSMYNPAGKSDDWMVTPQLLIDNKDIWLTFKTQGFRNNKQDRLKVIVWPCDEIYGSMSKQIIDRIRKEGTVIFDDRVLPGSGEQTLAGDWQEKKFQLDAFVGKNVYIAFANENENQSLVFVDDVKVFYNGKYETVLGVESTVVEKNEVEVSVQVKNASETPIKKISASYKNANTGSADSFTADVNVPKGETYIFSFSKPMGLEYGVENKYTVDIDIDGEKQTLSGMVKNLKYDFPKKVLVEEITGMWCGNCPQGTLAFEYLESAFPGQIIPVAIHNNDVYAYPAYESFIQLSGYPSGKVNRGTEVLSPMWNSQFYSAERDKTWYDYVSRELETPAEMKITIDKAEYCTKTEKMQVFYTVDYALNKENMDYNIFTVVLENELPSLQTNYFSEIDNPIYGEWGLGGEYGQHTVSCKSNHVARGIDGSSFYGRNGLLPSSGKIDEPYSGKIFFERPNLYHTDKDTQENKHMSIACVVIDNNTGAVITGDIIHTVGVTDIDSVEGITANGSDIILTVIDGTVFANGDERNVEIYTVNGQRVANEGLSGLYIVRAFDADGNAKVSKLVIR